MDPERQYGGEERQRHGESHRFADLCFQHYFAACVFLAALSDGTRFIFCLERSSSVSPPEAPDVCLFNFVMRSGNGGCEWPLNMLVLRCISAFSERSESVCRKSRSPVA